MLKALSLDSLDHVSGGMRWEDWTRSPNVDDLRGIPFDQQSPEIAPHLSPTEDGYLIGTRGEVFPDHTMNQTVNPTMPDDSGLPEHDGSTLSGHPLSESEQNEMSSLLNFNGPEQQESTESGYGPGEYVTESWNEYNGGHDYVHDRDVNAIGAAPEQSYEEPSYAEPSYAEPSYEEPSYAEPSYAEPSYDASAAEE